MRTRERDDIARRIEERAVRNGIDPDEALSITAPDGSRYTIDARWIVFECGCRAERTPRLYGYRPGEPAIFIGLPEQAVYDHVCDLHAAKMDEIVRLSGYGTFQSWRHQRRRQLMGA